MGTKAYRCLNNSRFVLVTIIFMRVVILGFGIWDIVDYRATKKLTGDGFMVLFLHMKGSLLACRWLPKFDWL